MSSRTKVVRKSALPNAAKWWVVILGSLLVASSVHAAELTGSSTLTSDYVWRGSSQTLVNSAMQGRIAVSGHDGFYASVWGSNVDFGPQLSASSEFDIALGWSREIGEGWAVDVSVARYLFPGTTVDLDWNEVNATLTWRERVWLGAAHSNNAMASSDHGTYVSGGARIPAAAQVRFEIGAGHYAMSDALPDYSHAWASALWAFKSPFELRITAHATGDAAETRFGPEVAGNRLEAALQASF